MMDPNKLIQLYLSQRLTDEEMLALNEWIVADPEHARVLARHCMLHSCIYTNLLDEELKVTLNSDELSQTSDQKDLSGTNAISNELILKDIPEEEEDKISLIKSQAEQQLQAFLKEQHELEREQRLLELHRQNALVEYRERILGFFKNLHETMSWGMKLGVQTLVLLSFLAITGLIIYGHYQHRVIATVVNEVETDWIQGGKSSQLKPGQYELKNGYAQVLFENKVSAIIHAPCKFRLKSLEKMTLEKGVITVKVPPAVDGFLVKTPSTKVLDLGTEFGVRVGDSGGAKTAVFDGSVELIGVRTSKDSAAVSVVLKENQQARINAKGLLKGDIRPLGPNHDFLRSWHEVLYLPEVFGQCQVLRENPSSVEQDALEDSTCLFVFHEKVGIQITNECKIPVVQPGPIDLEQGITTQTMISGNPLVDSYMIHFDPKNEEGEIITQHHCYAQISFPRTILGVIINNKKLTQSDVLFGDPEVAYPQESRGIEIGKKSSQYINLSEDLKTISLHLTAGKHIDQIRVLITAADQSSYK